ncbi:MAG: glutamine--fructose-6-phosphate transaminase (isomerizing) [Candidatus Kapabacteria bacterium]|nr:glutamine--fructose-6-phosphate transaminase (isomerizing) [Ignavibacteriota bacterium]MCW5883901.1 glutamine--fructose-6-phosphate transaminase (isomerizing) [Candidatus Kapabacteria bacterium]
MCGIIGYIGDRKVSSILLNGLNRMEYRGYDSAGVSILQNGKIHTLKKKGKVTELEKLVDHSFFNSTFGIAHTRWATHGYPNDVNAHPHSDSSGNISIVHNGIIENYSVLRTKLVSDGYTFKSDTDTEVLAVFIGSIYERVNDLETAVRLALREVDGTFGVLVISTYEPEKLIAARRGSPLLLGIGNNEYLAASDAAAVIQYTKQVIYLNDNEICTITRDGYNIKTIENESTEPIIEQIEFDLEHIEKSGYEHFMLKEIFEQPDTIHDAFRGRLLVDEGNVKLGGLRNVYDELFDCNRIIITACGTSWHSGLVAEYLIESLAGIPVEVEYASEFRYRNPIIKKNDIIFAISQSGETADTLAAVKEAKQKGATVLGIVNVVGSSIARETNAGVYIHAGPEIGVASTKAFTSQLTVFSLIALMLGRMRNLSKWDGQKIALELTLIPDKIKQILELKDQIRDIALQYSNVKNFLYLGRGYNFPVALEGALKLKEISYIHAEGYPAAEMKHGPIALIDENMPVVIIATKDEIYDKVFSNIEEVRARKGRVIAIANIGDEKIKAVADHVIYIPETISPLTPLLSVIPLQLLSYYIALDLECDIDKPRNLAKSVTVE